MSSLKHLRPHLSLCFVVWQICYKYLGFVMRERKTWTGEEDKILKYLKVERGESKWSVIAKTMDKEFGVKGKTGKQCRQRYHNHLDESILTTEWSKEQEQTLFTTHEMVGNKWSSIAQHLPGRSQNCVKNHFYSKLRKTVRKVNKISCQLYKRQVREIKMNLLYKIVQISELKFKNDLDEPHIQECREIESQFFLFDHQAEHTAEYLQGVRRLALRVNGVQDRLKKNGRRAKEHKGSTQTNYSNKGEDNGMQAGQSQRPFYEILKKVCEEIMLDNNE